MRPAHLSFRRAEKPPRRGGRHWSRWARRDVASRPACRVFDTGTAAVKSELPSQELTETEREILTLLLDGLTNKAAAERVGLALRTLERHRASALRKLGVQSLVQAARLGAVRQSA